MTNFTVEQVRERIATSNTSVERAILAIYARQTSDEQTSDQTKHSNNMGFTGADARMLSSFAKWIGKRSQYVPEGKRLSDKQIAYARPRLAKYAVQLLKVYKAQHPA
jgi:hypothetical protein